MLPRLFTMFSQGERARQRSGGLGIGLALVKGLVELHGGRVEARSAGPGQGSEFVVFLPSAGSEVAAIAPPRRAISGAGSKPCRIVVADDLRDSADSLVALLQAMGHEAHAAYDGAEAVRAGDRLEPEVMLLDLGMPNLDGYAACSEIRRRDWGQRTLVVALTGWGQEADRRRTAEAGFDHHLVKPVDLDDLTQLLSSWSGARDAG
jgi:CheY-like chemotaxis protein